MDSKTNPACREYFDKLGLETPITPEEFRNAIVSAHKARAMVSYFIWKELQVRCPADADEIMIAAYERFGVVSGEKWGTLTSAKQALLAQSSKSGYLVFRQELVDYTEEYAQKNFHYCPHIDAIRELGATPEEVRFFCQKILSAGDYGNMIPHPAVKLEFKTQIGAGDDHCAYCVSKVN